MNPLIHIKWKESQDKLHLLNYEYSILSSLNTDPNSKHKLHQKIESRIGVILKEIESIEKESILAYEPYGSERFIDSKVESLYNVAIKLGLKHANDAEKIVFKRELNRLVATTLDYANENCRNILSHKADLFLSKAD